MVQTIVTCPRCKQSRRRNAKLHKCERGFVYLVKAEGHPALKIGKTKYPSSRLSALQSGCPLPLSLVQAWEVHPYSKAEGKLIGSFLSKRFRGEWFLLTPEDIASIPDLLKQFVRNAERFENPDLPARKM